MPTMYAVIWKIFSNCFKLMAFCRVLESLPVSAISSLVDRKNGTKYEYGGTSVNLRTAWVPKTPKRKIKRHPSRAVLNRDWMSASDRVWNVRRNAGNICYYYAFITISHLRCSHLSRNILNRPRAVQNINAITIRVPRVFPKGVFIRLESIGRTRINGIRDTYSIIPECL